MREVKIKKVSDSNDEYNELWKVIGERKYYARNTYRGYTWYYVCGVNEGFNELDYVVENDVLFIICNDKGEELLRDSNNPNYSKSFMTVEETAIKEWKQMNIEVSTKSLRDWLASYCTPEICSQNGISYRGNCGELNWTDCWYQEQSKQVVKTFEYLGSEYCIYKAINKHRYCECEWITYFSGVKDIEPGKCYIAYYGYVFPEVYGEMYSNSEAISIVRDALKTIYKDMKYDVLHYVHSSYSINAEKK